MNIQIILVSSLVSYLFIFKKNIGKTTQTFHGKLEDYKT